MTDNVVPFSKPHQDSQDAPSRLEPCQVRGIAFSLEDSGLDGTWTFDLPVHIFVQVETILQEQGLTLYQAPKQITLNPSWQGRFLLHHQVTQDKVVPNLENRELVIRVYRDGKLFRAQVYLT